MRPLHPTTRILIAATCIAVVLPLSALADPSSFWLDARTGPSTFGGSLQGSLNYNTGPHLLKIRYTWVGTLFHYGLTRGHLDDRAHEVGLLYGLINRHQKVRLTAAAGIAYANVRDYEYVTPIGAQMDIDVHHFSGVGIPAEIGFSYQISPAIALASTMFADFNKQKTIAGVNLGLQFGALGASGQ